jgi:predicted DNA-binding transcriptional regulator AlpA
MTTILSPLTKLLTVQDVAEILGIDPHTIYNWRNLGRYPELKATPVGRHLRFMPEVVARFIQSETYRNDIAAVNISSDKRHPLRAETTQIMPEKKVPPTVPEPPPNTEADDDDLFGEKDNYAIKQS